MARTPVIDLAGQRFGRWLVVENAGNTSRGSARWAVVCDCGTRRAVIGTALRQGTATGCGCDRAASTPRVRPKKPSTARPWTSAEDAAWQVAQENRITEAAFRQRLAAGWPLERASAWPMGRRRQSRRRDLDDHYA